MNIFFLDPKNEAFYRKDRPLPARPPALVIPGLILFTLPGVMPALIPILQTREVESFANAPVVTAELVNAHRERDSEGDTTYSVHYRALTPEGLLLDKDEEVNESDFNRLSKQEKIEVKYTRDGRSLVSGRTVQHPGSFVYVFTAAWLLITGTVLMAVINK